MAPKVSVICSVYNGENGLRRAVESVLNQTMADIEFIIVDDASTDASPEILAEFDDARIVLTRNASNMGLSASLNRALQLARGEFVARQDHDDFSLPQRFEQQLKFLEAHSEVGVLGTQMETVDEQGALLNIYTVPTKHGMLAWNLFFDRSFAHPSVMMRRELVLKVGGYDESFLVSQDLDLWVRLLFETRFANLPEALIRYQSSPKAASQRRASEQFSNRMQMRQKLASQLLEQEVPLKVIKWLDASQRENCSLSREQRKTVLEFIYDVYAAMQEKGFIEEEDDAEVYPDLLERILSVGECATDGSKGKLSDALAGKISWALSNPGKAARKLISSLGSKPTQTFNSQDEGIADKLMLSQRTREKQLSIVVLTHARERGLASLLESLLMQELDGLGVELILVNNSPIKRIDASSGAKLGRLITNFDDYKLINNSHNWGTKARYSVATLAASNTILFLDDDLTLLDEHFLGDMYAAFRSLKSVDILSCWNELWLEWGEDSLRTVALDFQTPGIDELILSDTVGPGIAMFNRHLLLHPGVMDVAMQNNQEAPIVSDMGFSLAAAMVQDSEKYYFPAYGRLAFHEEAHSGAIYQIPKRHQDLLALYKRLSKKGYSPVMERMDELPKNQAERVSWAAETLPSKAYSW